MKTASKVLEFEETPLKPMWKPVRVEKFEKLLLKDAGDWALLKRFGQKHEASLTYLLAFGVGIIIGLAI